MILPQAIFKLDIFFLKTESWRLRVSLENLTNPVLNGNYISTSEYPVFCGFFFKTATLQGVLVDGDLVKNFPNLRASSERQHVWEIFPHGRPSIRKISRGFHSLIFKRSPGYFLLLTNLSIRSEILIPVWCTKLSATALLSLCRNSCKIVTGSANG